MKVADLCRQYGISDATFYNWKAKYGGMEVTCSLKTGPFIMRVFRAIFLAGRRSGRHESIEVFGRPEGVYSQAGR